MIYKQDDQSAYVIPKETLRGYDLQGLGHRHSRHSNGFASIFDVWRAITIVGSSLNRAIALHTMSTNLHGLGPKTPKRLAIP